MKRQTGLIGDRRATQMAEAAIVLPVILLSVGVMMDFTRAGAASVAAAHAAAYGARVGAVARTDPSGWAAMGTTYALDNSGIKADNTVTVFSSGSRRSGGAVLVVVSWKIDAIWSGLCGLFGDVCPDTIEGTSGASYKMEGW